MKKFQRKLEEALEAPDLPEKDEWGVGASHMSVEDIVSGMDHFIKQVRDYREYIRLNPDHKITSSFKINMMRTQEIFDLYPDFNAIADRQWGYICNQRPTQEETEQMERLKDEFEQESKHWKGKLELSKRIR